MLIECSSPPPFHPTSFGQRFSALLSFLHRLTVRRGESSCRPRFIGLAAFVCAGALIAAGCTPTDETAEASTGSHDDEWTVVDTEGEPTARHENAFVEVDGKFYLLGGRGEHPVDIYDPSSNAWSSGATPPMEIHHFQASSYDGKIYVIGAWTGGYPDERGVEHVLIYDPQEDAWSTGPEIPEDRRRGAAGVAVFEDHIYVVAGNNGGHGPHATAVTWFDRFDPRSGSWETLGSAPRGRDHFQAAVVGRKLYVAGGRDSGVEGFADSTVAEVDVYDFDSESWSTLEASPIPTERAGSATVAVGSSVIVIGGEGFGRAWDESEALDTSTGEWTLIGRLNQARHGTQAVVADGRIWIAAGSGDQGGSPELTLLEAFSITGME